MSEVPLYGRPFYNPKVVLGGCWRVLKLLARGYSSSGDHSHLPDRRALGPA